MSIRSWFHTPCITRAPEAARNLFSVLRNEGFAGHDVLMSIPQNCGIIFKCALQYNVAKDAGPRAELLTLGPGA